MVCEIDVTDYELIRDDGDMFVRNSLRHPYRRGSRIIRQNMEDPNQSSSYKILSYNYHLRLPGFVRIAHHQTFACFILGVL